MPAVEYMYALVKLGLVKTKVRTLLCDRELHFAYVVTMGYHGHAYHALYGLKGASRRHGSPRTDMRPVNGLLFAC